MVLDLRRSIKIFSTLGKSKLQFVPSTTQLDIVSMYHCGPTVYQRAHIGNIRSYVMADTIRRTFEAAGYTVRQVINITDVGHLTDDADAGEDKLEREAKKTNISAMEISQKYTQLFLEDLEKMNIKTDGTVFPKATDHIAEQIELIQKLQASGHTYRTSDAIYFDTATFPEYGKLGNISLNEHENSARIDENLEKRHPADFALWKFSPSQIDPSAPARQQEWDSPWGVGFPGWHIECSAMSMKYLGETFDIHTGGIDHIPVHHNNEIAQSEAVTHTPLARYWIHNNHITLDDQKISKSLNNSVTLDNLKDKNIHPLSYRYWLLTAHHASQANLTEEALFGAQKAYERLNNRLQNVSTNIAINELAEKYFLILADDFNTPGLLAEIWKDLKSELDESKLGTIKFVVENWLGLPITNLNTELPEHIAEIAKQREIARAEKDWQKSDLLRSQIEAEGYTVKDEASGQKIIKN